MSLNIVNKTTAIFSGLKKAGLPVTFPLTGFVSGMGSDCFKYSPTGSVNDVLAIKQIDLGLLFKDIPLDLCEFDFTQPSEDVPPTPELVVDNPVQSEPLFTNWGVEESIDLFKSVFNKWCLVYGIQDLGIKEVSLGISHNHLRIDVTKSDVYTGGVSVKFRDLPTPEVVELPEPENLHPVPTPSY